MQICRVFITLNDFSPRFNELHSAFGLKQEIVNSPGVFGEKNINCKISWLERFHCNIPTITKSPDNILSHRRPVSLFLRYVQGM